MKKKLLVIGDSFMLPDPEYSQRHWSEMIPDYEIMMHARSGASNGIIAYNFFQGLEQKPDAVVIGFSAVDRIEFQIDQEPSLPHYKWVTGSHSRLNSVQKLAVDYYKTTTCTEMQLFKSLLIARSIFLTLEKANIPYAYSLNLMFNNSEDKTSQHYVESQLKEFEHHQCATNLATYPNWKSSPGFHTDDIEWQKRFAVEVTNILSNY